jgi:radical SAM protein with 4Fe4S-binding SPASM domain
VSLTLQPPVLPTRIDVEPTIRCNFECITCQRTYWDRTAPDMTFEQFQHIYESFPRIKHLKIQGIGEPMLNRDLWRMVAFAKQRNSFVMTYTNGSYLHVGDNAAHVLNSGLDLLFVSIDGGTRETFESLRRLSSFDLVVENLAALIRRRGGGRTPHIGLWVVGTPQNIRELPQIVDLAKTTGADEVFLQVILNTFSYKQDVGNRLVQLQLARNEDSAALLNSAMEYARAAGVLLTMATDKAYSESRKCQAAWETAYISVEGLVVPCCTIADPRVSNMGNILEEPIEKIWTGDRYREFRSRILNHDLLAPCLNCYEPAHRTLIANSTAGLEGAVPAASYTCHK